MAGSDEDGLMIDIDSSVRMPRTLRKCRSAEPGHDIRHGLTKRRLCVPAREHRGLPFPAQDPDTPGAKGKSRSRRHLHGEPPRSDHAQDVAVGEGQRVPAGVAQPPQHPVRPCADLGRLLSPGTAVAPKIPVGVRFTDLRCREALVLAVVPLVQVIAQLRDLAIAGQRTGFAGAEQRTAQHHRVVTTGQLAAQRPGSLASRLDERQVGVAGVPAGGTPLGLAVADDHDFAHRQAPNTSCTPARTAHDTSLADRTTACSYSCWARSAAPSTPARTPCRARRILAWSAKPGWAYSRATRVAGTSSRSPASAPPPPRTTSSGSNVLIAFATPIPTRSAQISTVRTAVSSPSRAAATAS